MYLRTMVDTFAKLMAKLAYFLMQFYEFGWVLIKEFTLNPLTNKIHKC